jgi:hypothetical protein
MTVRDPAADAVLTGESLIEQFRALIPRLGSTLGGDLGPAIGKAQHVYPEIWSNPPARSRHRRTDLRRASSAAARLAARRDQSRHYRGVLPGGSRSAVLATKMLASKEDATPAGHQQLAEIRERLDKNPCDAPSAEELVKHLRIQGQLRAAKEFGKDFLARCGDDAYIPSRVAPESR